VASCRVLVKRSAAKEIEAIGQKRDRQRVVEQIRALADAPRPRGCEKLSGVRERYRVRVGRYRILYEVLDAELVVWVVKIGHRKDVYRGTT
jgi:mRNA interferase RelE/StbE